MVPKPNQAGLLAWRVPIFELPIYTELFARTGSDYGLNAYTDGIEHLYSILSVNYEFWGVPSEPVHDPQRDGVPNEEGFGDVPSDLPPVPFLQNPTSCTATPQLSYANLSSYEGNSHRVTLRLATDDRLRPARASTRALGASRRPPRPTRRPGSKSTSACRRR